jgi:tetratricopeptide (TPR) repeat protein
MAVAIRFNNVVLRKSAVDAKLSGILPQAVRDVPHLCHADDHLLVWRAMMDWDTPYQLALALQSAGLRQGFEAHSDFAIVSPGFGPYPKWLEVGSIPFEWACWLKGTEPGDFVCWSQGETAFHKRDYDHAITLFNETIRLDPEHANSFFYRGLSYAGKGQSDQAIADFTEVVRLEPENATAYNNRGHCYKKKGDYDKAIADYSQAIRLEPKFDAPYNNRGVSYAAKGEFDKAIAHYTDAIRLQPTQPIFYTNRAKAFRALGDEAKAASDEKKAKELST